MKMTKLHVAVLGCFLGALASGPAFADQISDLKAEIAAQ